LLVCLVRSFAPAAGLTLLLRCAGELKKLVAAKTGLHPDDQKVLYKDKERDSKAFLDMAGVKDRSKVVVVEDPEARARRLIEERRNGHLEKAARAVAAVTAGVDKLAPKVHFSHPHLSISIHPSQRLHLFPSPSREQNEQNRGLREFTNQTSSRCCSPLILKKKI